MSKETTGSMSQVRFPSCMPRVRALVVILYDPTHAVVCMIALMFVPAFWAFTIIKEKEIGAKHLQLISGVSLPAYWLTSWLWDFVSYLPAFVLGLVILYGFNVTALIGSDHHRAAGVIALLLLYGSSSAGFTYLLTFMFKNASTGQV
jgi:ATP-binding cassette, subfamily A (ABC1), member 3